MRLGVTRYSNTSILFIQLSFSTVLQLSIFIKNIKHLNNCSGKKIGRKARYENGLSRNPAIICCKTFTTDVLGRDIYIFLQSSFMWNTYTNKVVEVSYLQNCKALEIVMEHMKIFLTFWR